MSKPWSAEADLRGQLARRFGRRGAFLGLFGLLWLFIGFGVATVPTERFSRPGPGGPLQFMDSQWWGLMWMTCGVVAIVWAFIRRRRHGHDEWGFNALLTPPMVWAGAYGWSWVTFCVTEGEFGRHNGWVGALVFFIAILAILVVAGWPDPSDQRTEN